MSILKKIDYDERTREILTLMAEGKSREELADYYGMANWKSLDTHMRRRNFVWDTNEMTYVGSRENGWSQEENRASGKCGMIIGLFDKESPQPMEIAKIVGFSDHMELAGYMAKKGYEWSSERKNYVLRTGRIDIGKEGIKEEGEHIFNVGNVNTMATGTASMGAKMANGRQKVIHGDCDGEIEKYLPLLEILLRHKDRLIDILAVTMEGKLPHYGVPGVQKTKSIYMSNMLSSLLTEFCESKNISQKQLVEGDVIEYLRRYGFNREVDELLKS